MEIITLVKAGIRSKKGIAIGFMLLNVFIVISVISIIGVWKNYKNAIQNAFEYEDKGTICAFFRYGVFTEDYQREVEASEMVNFLEVQDGLIGVNIHNGENEDGNGYIVTKMFDTISVYNNEATELSKYDKSNKEYSLELKRVRYIFRMVQKTGLRLM